MPPSTREDEVEKLLKAAARIAAATYVPGAKLETFLMTIKGLGSWFLDSSGTLLPGTSREVPASGGDIGIQLTYASVDVFLDLVHRRLNPRMAALSGKVSFRGNLALAKRLSVWLSAAVAEGRLTGAAPDKTFLVLAPREKWQADDDVDECAVCGEEFKVYRRRHHCRYCGHCVCDDCSGKKLKGHRACTDCHARSREDRKAASAANATVAGAGAGAGVAAVTGVGGGGTEQVQPGQPVKALGSRGGGGGYIGQVVDTLKSRVLELEEQVAIFSKKVPMS